MLKKSDNYNLKKRNNDSYQINLGLRVQPLEGYLSWCQKSTKMSPASNKNLFYYIYHFLNIIV